MTDTPSNSESDKLTHRILGHAQRFVGNDDPPREDMTEIELSDWSGEEVEFAFTLKRDRYYIRVRRADLLRLANYNLDPQP